MIDYIDNNVFLKSIFPMGLTEGVLIGQIAFDVGGRLSLNIHTRQKPAKEIIRWGKWGENYNVIVIELKGVGGDLVNITNWKDASYSELHADIINGKNTLSCMGNSWSIKLECHGLIFQKCSTYID